MEEILNPNCSEAVCRVLLDNLTDKEKHQIIKLLNFIDSVLGVEKSEHYEIDENKPINEQEFGDSEFEKEIKENWGLDTEWYIETIFGMEVVVIRGDSPYHHPEWLERVLREKLPFGKKLKIEFSDLTLLSLFKGF